MKFRMARNVTMRLYFEFEAADETAAAAAVHQLNEKIVNGEDYDVEDIADYVHEKDVGDDEEFELTGWRE